METKLITIRRITLGPEEVREAIRSYIGEHHDPPFNLPDDCEINIDNDGWAYIEVRVQQPKPDPSEAIDPDEMMRNLESNFQQTLQGDDE
ncbi:MAG: hypothetical protein KAJ73_10345 [Zetaproteobacteria bacterium]|nr:hypothetical protein [Zetaproteobacteria bacterium]